MKIVNFGSCNIDYVYSVDHVVVSGETEDSSCLEIFPGGKGLNQSVAIAKAGKKVFHAGCIGRGGEILVDALKDNGVNISLLKKVQTESGHAIIQLTKEGENSIILFRGANGFLDKEYIQTVFSTLSKGDVILLQNETNNVSYIIDEAYKNGITTVFNPAPFSDNLKDVDYNKISYLIVNEIEAQGIGGKNTPEQNIKEITKRYQGVRVVLTIGDKGALYVDNGEIKHQSSMIVDVEDTTAAGDTFIGYFVAEITKTVCLQKAVKIATVASALAVTKKGASVSIPSRKEVDIALKTLKENSCGNYREQVLKEKISSYIIENLGVAKLGELAKVLGYSCGHAGELVSKIFGLSFSELVKDFRCEKAAKLLVETDLSIAEIIYTVGYANESFFRKAFKEKFGKTPYQYSKNKKGER